MNPKNLNDVDLYRKASFYGKKALLWRRKFMGLLPELHRRRLWEVHGFNSVFEFAFKVAGLSEEQVRRVLNLEKRFFELPTLHGLLVSGAVSASKLARVASIADPKNEEDLAEAVQLLPQSAVETLVRDMNGLSEAQNEAKSVRAHELKLGEPITLRLLALQDKGFSLDELLGELLDRRETEIAQEKAAIADQLPQKQSRPIPARTRRLLKREHGSKCSIRTCQKPAQQIHHTQTFALSHVHDPHYLSPLCKNHHVLAHAINLKVREKREAAIL